MPEPDQVSLPGYPRAGKLFPAAQREEIHEKIIGVLLTAAAFFLMSAQVSAEEPGYIRWGYTPDGCWYQESILNEDYGFRFEKGENCEFSCEWEMCRQRYAELGLKLPGMIRTEDITGLYVEYEAEMRLTGNNYFVLHCKMRDLPGMTAAKEIFTVEAWGAWRPPGGGTLITSDRVDGALYDYYYTLRVNQPTVEGIRDCEQFWCVRKEASGIAYRRMYYKEKLPLSQHFRTLQRVGAIYPDEMPESAALYLDCYDGDGDGFLHVIKADYHLSYTAQVTTAPVTTAVTTTTTTVPAVTVPKKAADADGCYFRSDFENGSDRWQTRGKARLRHDESNYVDGHSSLRVTDRQDYGSGVGFFLTPYAVGPDETYSVRVCVMQKADELMNLRLYLDCPGINGMCIADAWAIRGQWTVLESTFSVAHYIPDGNEVLRLYIEADSPDADFYIDAAGFWDEGCMPELDISAAVSDFVPQTVQHTESDDGLELRRHQNDTYTYVYGEGGVKDLVGPYFRAGFCASAEVLRSLRCRNFTGSILIRSPAGQKCCRRP